MLPKKNRLTSDYNFRMVRRKGRRISSPFFDLYYLERRRAPSPRLAGYPPSRFGFVVSTKLDKRAVKRNRVKRVFREAIRPLLPEIKDGFDFVFWVRRRSLEMKSDRMQAVIETVLKKSGLLVND